MRAAERRSVVLHIRVKPGESRAVRAEARRRGVTLSDLLLGPWRQKGGSDGTRIPDVSKEA